MNRVGYRLKEYIWVNFKDFMENRVNKTLHLKRKCTENSKHDYQCLSYDFVNWTEGNLAQLNSCLKYFKERSNGEFDFYIGECGKLGGSLLESDAPDGFYPAVDQARKEEKERLEKINNVTQSVQDKTLESSEEGSKSI